MNTETSRFARANGSEQMRGTLTVPHASIIGAVSYAKALGCLVLAAKVDETGCVLDVSAPEKALGHLGRAHAAGRVRFEPAALQEALRAVSAFSPETDTVRGTLIKRRAGRAFCREMQIPVYACRRARTLELDVVVPASMIRELAQLEALGELTFAPARADDVAVRMPSGDCVQALAWSAGAAGLQANSVHALDAISGGYALLVAAAVVRTSSGARPMREQSSYAA
jgi:hypothetical protein